LGRFNNPPNPRSTRTAWRSVSRILHEMATVVAVPDAPDINDVRSWQQEAGSDNPDRTKRLVDLAELLHIFLAHTRRQQYSDTPLNAESLHDLEKHYFCALTLARRQDDSWNQPWIYYELGEAEHALAERLSVNDASAPEVESLERRAFAAARRGYELARTAAEDPDELDFEILSLCERLMGEVLWASDKEASVEHLALSVHYAHCFEVWPEPQPDPYTLHFERAQRYELVRLLSQLDAKGDGTNRDVQRRLVEEIAGFVGKDPDAVWTRWNKADLPSSGDRRAMEALADVLFEPEGEAESLESGSPRGYRLPPTHGVVKGQTWVKDLNRSQVEAFRQVAVVQILRVQERNTDLGLVELPEELVRRYA
jgi:hypothetical protein